MDASIQWFPGHMAKAKRQITADLKWVDAVIEVVDARAPASSSNSELGDLASRRPLLRVVAKADLADPDRTGEWLAQWRAKGVPALALDLQHRGSRAAVLRALRRFSPRRKGGAGLKAMVVGIPNVGKSTLINLLAGKASLRTGALPGVTRGKQQWIHLAEGVHLLDTPGVLWPHMSDPQTGYRLAWIGCIGEKAYDAVPVAEALLRHLAAMEPGKLAKRYGDEVGAASDLLEAVGRRRGMLIAGGGVDKERVAQTVLKEFREGRLGRITLDKPEPADV